MYHNDNTAKAVLLSHQTNKRHLFGVQVIFTCWYRQLDR